MSAKRRSNIVRMATAIPPSLLIKSELGRTQDPAQLSVEQEIKRYRERFFFLQDRYHGLIAAFHMLRPLLKNEPLRKRLEKEGKQRAASLMAVVLFEACVLDCHTMLVDGDEDNPSICTLTRPFRSRADNGKLLDRLASLYSDRKPYWPDASKVGVFSRKDQARWITKNRRADASRRLTFWRMADRLRADWNLLAKAGESLRPFRNAAVAHLRVELDKAANSYRLPEFAALNKLYTTIEEILPIITRSVANLAAILIGGGDRLNLFERQAKQNAAIFWGLSGACLSHE
jgi:AbiU2